MEGPQKRSRRSTKRHLEILCSGGVVHSFSSPSIRVAAQVAASALSLAMSSSEAVATRSRKFFKNVARLNSWMASETTSVWECANLGSPRPQWRRLNLQCGWCWGCGPNRAALLFLRRKCECRYSPLRCGGGSGGLTGTRDG